MKPMFGIDGALDGLPFTVYRLPFTIHDTRIPQSQGVALG